MEAVGPEALHARLASLDPAAAGRVAPRDRQRITRALEVVESSGKPLSWWHAHAAATPAAEEWVHLELVAEPGTLREQIARRTRWMFDHGLVDETRGLVEAGHGEALRELRAVGYDEALALLAGSLSREEAERRTDQRTAQLAKRQRTWFRHQVEAVRLDPGALGEKGLLEAALAALRASRRARPVR
jgi:tRNA dimethylallyltransferase